MDPISHALFGGSMAAAAGRPRPRGVVWAFVVGSLFPDIDGFWVFRGFDVYLQHHATETHSFLATPLEAFALAVILKGLLRGVSFRPVFFAALAGCAGHIFWDMADGSDMYVFAPLSSRVFGWHLVSMVEPVFIAAVLLPVLVAMCARKWTRHALAVSAGLIVGLLAVKAVSQRAAWATYAQVVSAGQAPSISGDLTRIAPVSGSLTAWTIFDRSTEHVRAWRVDARTGSIAPVFERTYPQPSAIVLVSREWPVVQRFLTLDGIPFPRVERRDDERLVLWSDVRQCHAATCDVSFGVAFDENDRPMYQLVRVGPVERRTNLLR